MTRRVQVIDSHTGGEPTRIIISGGPDLGTGPLSERVERFRNEFDHYRCGVIHEPRGSEVLVGGLLTEPVDASCAAGIIFFNDVSYLGMCGHGTIGLFATLAHLERISLGEHRLETPVGIVTVTLEPDGSVAVENVASYREAQAVEVDVPGIGRIVGDVAWGGNWFFLVYEHDQELNLANTDRLLMYTRRIRQAVNEAGFPLVDHVELYASPDASHDASEPEAHSRNFVLCPGYAYDRSPCGTGTSAKLACLAADGKLAEGEHWVQESVIGSRFVGSFRWEDQDAGRVLPTIRGRAFVNGESTLIFQDDDPFCWGIPQPEDMRALAE
ncbi:MAG: proline racemase family protein [Pirellulales bacterium]|nr:proline racemase family protein [Pirellulales bacterium]